MQTSGFRIGHKQALFGPGNAHVAQAPLFLETVGFFHRHAMGEEVFLHAGDKNHGKLQALGRVQCHHLHAVFKLVGLLFAGIQCRLIKEGPQQGYVFVVRFKLARRCNQLLQVLDTGLALLAFFFFVKVDQARCFDGVFNLLIQRQIGNGLLHAADQFTESAQRAAGSGGEDIVPQTALRRRPQ